MALVYCAVFVVGMCAVGSLALDYGRAQCVKTELRRAAEAAAFAAIQEIRDGNGITAAQNAAVSAAALNLADGSAVVVDPDADVEFGTYDASTDTFETLTGTARASAQAVHVTCRRTAARGTAVPLVLGVVIGMNSVDVTDDAVASVNATSRFVFVGLNSVYLHDTDINSFDSAVGAYGGSNVKGNASVASNGNITMAAGCKIHSEAHPGISGSIIKDGASQINASTPYNSGTSWPIQSPATANLTGGLYYPLPDASAAATTNDNAQFLSKIDGSNNVNINADMVITGGTFYVNNFTMTKKLTLNSKTIMYVNGTCTINGEMKTYLTNPVNLSIYVMGSGATNITTSKPLYGTIYAPLSDVLVESDNVYGQIIGKTLATDGGAHHWHYDEALANGSDGGPSKKKWLKKPQKWIKH
jgi:hypothetical protein